MRARAVLPLLICSTVTLQCATAPNVESPSLVPQPKLVALGAGASSSSRVHVAADTFPAQASLLAASLQKLGASASSRARDAAMHEVRFQSGELPDDVTYRIDVGQESTVVTANTATGAAQAVATLLQSVTVIGERASWPIMRVEDGPDVPYRSFMVDMGRNPHSKETLRKVVDMLWFFKAEQLHLHLTDDQIFSWPSSAFPKLQSKQVDWSLQDFVDLEAYAQARGIVIIPELDVPGHSTILRREYPEVFGKTPTELADRGDRATGYRNSTRRDDRRLQVVALRPRRWR